MRCVDKPKDGVSLLQVDTSEHTWCMAIGVWKETSEGTTAFTPTSPYGLQGHSVGLSLPKHIAALVWVNPPFGIKDHGGAPNSPSQANVRRSASAKDRETGSGQDVAPRV